MHVVVDVHGVAPPKAVARNLSHIVRLHSLVVKLAPLSIAPSADDGVIMSRKSRPRMNHHADKLVLVVFGRMLLASIYGGGAIRLAESLRRVRAHVELERKLKPILQLEPLHRLVIKLETFELDDQRVRKVFDARALHGVHLGLAPLAVPLVVAFEQLAGDVRGERLDQVALVAYIDRHKAVVLLSLAAVCRARTADDLVHKLPPHDSLHRSLWLRLVFCLLLLQICLSLSVVHAAYPRSLHPLVRINLVLKAIEKLNRILVLAQVDGHPVIILERSPETPRREVVEP
mmetsp:Transcript_26886/g.88226  ORF Transcript_26886/g.88226 Transcript_26886/m.88226 type:complete len:288 (-) Transcript_26886:4866-5729(-)